MPRFTPLVEGLPSAVPFVGPEAQERAMGARFKARIGANENVFGTSPKALSAMLEASLESWQYADPESHDLRCALAEKHQVGFENVVVGEGIDGLLGYLVRMLVEPGTTVVTSSGAYPTFNYHVHGYGGRLVCVPYVADKECAELLVRTANREGAAIVYLANPDNPMGTYSSAKSIMKELDRLSEDCVMVVDEAYVECAPADAAMTVDIDRPNLIVMRTFSKAYGMAGARVGYAMGSSELVGAFEKVRNHFGMSRPGQAAALAALQDEEHLVQVVRQITESKERIRGIAENLHMDSIPSAANFVAIDCQRGEDYAREVLNALARRGIFVRMPMVWPQSRCIRVSAGTQADLDLLERHLPHALDEAYRIRYRR
ncbi:MAG: pyridoxal phosphate-dependent aminotransferase [Rhodobacteraceae bacterium]|nr:pyridoxal phosphate-dependent aminotransferase [Paracoccaceae bacterium]